MTWDGNERRSDDLSARVASLEAYSKVQSVTIRDLRYDIGKIREGVSGIRQDIHGARMAGRMGFGIAMILVSLVAWIASTILGR